MYMNIVFMILKKETLVIQQKTNEFIESDSNNFTLSFLIALSEIIIKYNVNCERIKEDKLYKKTKIYNK